MNARPGTPAPAGFQPQRLEARLRETLPGLRGPMRIVPQGGGIGAGASYRLDFDDHSLLLRLAPAGGSSGTAGAGQLPALRREQRILAALAAHGVPVPRTVLVCDDGGVAGAPCHVAALPRGRVFAGESLPELAPAQRRGVYFAQAETLARLHRVDWAAAGLAEYAPPAHYFAREVAHGNRQAGMPPALAPALAPVGAWLAAHVPEQDDSAIHHGDFRLANLIFDPSGSRVLALCGWERAALGHPLADAAHSCLPWQLPRAAGGIRDLDLARHGIPSQAEYLTHYRQCGGHAEGVTTFHLVFALFRAALRAHGGNGRRRAALARRALELTDGAST